MKKLLITGFTPFDGKDLNPSWLAVRELPAQIGDVLLCKLEIPTVFGEASLRILEKADEFSPDMILCVGVAAGRDAVTPERIAVNIRDAKIPDNAGNQPQGEFIADNGPAAYFATVPVEKMAQAIRDAGIRGAVSNCAGTFVCNDVMYSLLHHYTGTHVKVGFIHVPQLPEQGTPSMELNTIIAALEAAICACK